MEENKVSTWKKDTRFYVIELSKNIFDEWQLKTTWGSNVKKDFGKSKTVDFLDYQSALAEYEKAMKHRAKRGYQLN